MSVESEIKAVALSAGATECGIASTDRLRSGPPSADPTYVMADARSVISYAIAFDYEILAQFMAKEAFEPFVKHKKELETLLYMVGDTLAEHTVSLGHKAHVVSINSVYRPEPGVPDPSEARAMIPDFSLRYGAVAAGLGRIGWSGNVMTAENGAAVVLGAVITDAALRQDPLLEENPCDRCMACVRVCPSDMIKRQESVKIEMFGLVDEIAAKRTNNACYMSCTDYHGLAPDGKWSNWSPYRQEGGLPEDDDALDQACDSCRKVDPNNEKFFGKPYREFITDPDEKLHSPCGFCSYICAGKAPQRHKTRMRIQKSGITVLRPSGERAVIRDDQEIVEVKTMFSANVAMLKSDVVDVLHGATVPDPDGTDNIRDREVLAMMQSRNFTFSNYDPTEDLKSTSSALEAPLLT